VADVRRERELAERRKNEPQLDHNQDHLVRKIFSKFRRGTAGASTAGSNHAALPHASTPVATPDVERGGGASDSESACSTRLSTAPEEVNSVMVTTAAAIVATPAPAIQTTSRAASRWGRLLGSASSGAESSDKETARPTSTLCVKERPTPPPPTGSGNKVFPKQATPHRSARQETIEEIAEVEERRVVRTALRKAESNDSGILRSSEQRLSEPPPPPVSPLVPAIAPLPAPELQLVLASIAEFKVDVRLELQRLGQRAARLEEMLCSVTERLGNVSSSTATTPAPSEEDAPRSARSHRSAESSSTAPSSAAPSVSVRKRRSKSRATKPPAPSTPASDEPASASASASARSDEDEARPCRTRPREYL
jgi:potassium voltage-gated channel Eag-related subfamily H protein 5